MKRFSTIFIITVFALLSISCSKKEDEGVYADEQIFLDAWLEKYHADAQKIGRGVYMLSQNTDNVLDGADTIKKDGFAFLNYKVMDIEGVISSFTDEQTARILGQYNANSYYGPKVLSTTPESNYAGILDAIDGMRIGEKRTVLIPKWLMSTKDFESEDEFLAQSLTSVSTTIYEIEACNFTTDISAYEIGLVKEYVENYITENGISKESVDSLAPGMYMITLKEPIDTVEFPSDSTFYINYTGSLLSGKVFDTNIEKLAKKEGLYSSSRTYGASKAVWNTEPSEIKLGESSVIPGFYTLLYNMRSMQKAIGVFQSELGYSWSGSEPSIPPYAPLVFEVEMTEAPQE